VTLRFFTLFALTLAGLQAHSAHAQLFGRATVEQIQSRPSASMRAGDKVRVQAVRGGSSSASSREGQRETPAPRVAPEVIEACRAAQASDRPPPEGIDCIAAMQAMAQAQAQSGPTAEGSLLEMFGQSGNITGAPTSGPAIGSVSADNVARQVSAGEVSGSAAGIVARERISPPPNNPR
jgi:hypothetical protein